MVTRSVVEPFASLRHVLSPKLAFDRRTSRGMRITRIVFAAVGVLIGFVLYAASVWFLNRCLRVEVIGPLLIRRLLDVVLLALTSVLLLSNVITALTSFFLSDDLDLLVSAPIAPRTFFAARFSEQVVQSSWMVLAFGFPVLLAFWRVCGDWTTLLATVAVLPPLLIIPARSAFLPRSF